MQKGFVSIPILIIGIVVSLVAVGGAGTIAYNMGKNSNTSDENYSPIATSTTDQNDVEYQGSANETVVQASSSSTDLTNTHLESSETQTSVPNNLIKEEPTDVTTKPIEVVDVVNIPKTETTVKDETIVTLPKTTPTPAPAFDWNYWLGQVDGLKQTKKDLNNLLDSKERTITGYEDAKDSYAKWSPLLKDTIAGDLASKGYSQLDAAIDSEENAIKVGEEYKDSIDAVLDSIEAKNEITLESAVSLNTEKFEEFKTANVEAQTQAEIAQRNINNFQGALESMGY